MHRRNRHYNPGNAGASVYVDARYIKGATDNTRMLTWSPNKWLDRSGNDNHVVGTNDGARDPIYIANSANINGQPVVRHIVPTFGNITSTYGSKSFTVTQNSLTVIVLASNAAGNNTSALVSFNANGVSDQATTGWRALSHGDNGTLSWLEFLKDGTRYFETTGGGTAVSNITKNQPYVLTSILNNTSVLQYIDTRLIQSKTISAGSTLNSTEVWFGRNTVEGGNSRWGGDFGCITIFKSVITDALRQRVSQSFAFKFKTRY
jgi:hypothetical protein